METPVNVNSICEKCEGRGYIYDEKENLVPCECKKEKEFVARLSISRIPKRFAGKNFKTFKGRDKLRREIIEAAKAYVQGFNLREEHAGLLLVGAIGSGKSHIAISMLKEIIRKGYIGIYFDVPELLQKVRETYDSRRMEVESDIFEEAAAADILLLDDLGAEGATGWVRERLALIIDRRYKDNKPLLVTTSSEPEELEAQIGRRSVSRLCEMCQRFVDFPKEDFRKREFK